MALIEREIHGYRMLLDDRDPGLSTELLTHGTREQEAPILTERIVQPGWTCLEIGANLGFYALIEAKAGARVYAIEPVPRCINILRRNVELNGFSNVSIHETAIGNRNGTALFHESAATNWGRMANAKARPQQGKEIAVLEMKLDTFVAAEGIERIDLLRFDVEGYEVELIEGAQKTLSEMPVGSWMFAEFHPRCFDDPARDLQPTVENIIGHGFVPRHVIPVKELGNFPASQFAEVLCTRYRDMAPEVFLEKCV